ncbi:putative short-chain dehydrogenase [Xylariaceae sp. AK1471]|nr:putative short-chain dehydrogenase [Xylariaceae sp. AK1471]
MSFILLDPSYSSANILTKANSRIGFEVANQLLTASSFRSRNLPGTIKLMQLNVADKDLVAATAKSLDALVNNLTGDYFALLLKKAARVLRIVNYSKFGADRFKVFLYRLGPTMSSLGPNSKNKAPRIKLTSVNPALIVKIIKGSRDKDAGKYLEYGHKQESFL